MVVVGATVVVVVGARVVVVAGVLVVDDGIAVVGTVVSSPELAPGAHAAARTPNTATRFVICFLPKFCLPFIYTAHSPIGEEPTLCPPIHPRSHQVP